MRSATAGGLASRCPLPSLRTIELDGETVLAPPLRTTAICGLSGRSAGRRPRLAPSLAAFPEALAVVVLPSESRARRPQKCLWTNAPLVCKTAPRLGSDEG